MKSKTIDKEEILNHCRQLIMEQGLDNINMRNVAKRCDIALGSLYNYFPNKNALLIDVIRDVWQHIFHMDGSLHFNSFYDCLIWFNNKITEGEKQYPGFINIHTLIIGADIANNKEAALQMHMWLAHIENSLLKVLNNDPNIIQNRFNETFTKQRFIKYCIQQIVSLHMSSNKDYDEFLHIIKAYCYN